MLQAPWDAIGGGKFQTKAQLEERKKNNEKLRGILGPPEQTEQEAKMTEALDKVGKEHGIDAPTAVALAYVMAKAPNVFPIVGGRKVEHLHANIQALKIKLTQAQIEELEAVVAFDPGFPNTFVGEDPHVTGGAPALLGAVAPMSFVRSGRPIGHE